MAAQRKAPIGVRGVPAGPRANLARADSSAIQHSLYVKVVTGTDPDRKSRELTLEVLRYVHSRLPAFTKMGLSVKVNKLRSQDLADPRLIDAMRRRGVTRLPALTTATNVYLGFREISDVYERNIKEYLAMTRRGERPVEGAAPEDDDLARHFRDEMTFERAEEDAGEVGIGDIEDMMDSYRRMMDRRDKSEAGRRPRGRAGGARLPPDDHRGAPPPPRAAPAPPPARRPDNVGPPPARRPASDPDDAEFDDLINRLAQDIDEGTRTRAFSGGGGDSLEGDGDDAQDDVMERAFYGAHVASSDGL